ncbi:iron-siderophore ABC transporter substrate-binding protein [Mycobacterium sp.]|uniref:iron-siderophore ABC transporter substrate-binding protein n=1 Tax=Mycobacterium sp. TaxID=1785 RepID=UPI003A89B815
MHSGGLRSSLATVFATAIALACVGCGSAQSGKSGGLSSGSLVTPTTQIAGAGVLGNTRKPDQSCAPDAAAADPGPPTRPAPNAAGAAPDEVQVPADPQRIVVLGVGQLDALCALGLQSRIVAAALPAGSSTQLSYLGTVVADLPAVGSQEAPEVSAIAETHPDLILGSAGSAPDLYPQLAAIAPTVFTGAPGAAWADNLRGIGAATARGEAAGALIEDFARYAATTGDKHDAPHFQVSVVQLTDTTMRVYGADNFAASVLSAVGVDRPIPQRFTDKPYIEFGTTTADLARDPDFSAANGDIIFVSCASKTAAQRAATVFDSTPWRKLGATRDNRVFVVNDEIWHTGQGVIAARGVVVDAGWISAPIN